MSLPNVLADLDQLSGGRVGEAAGSTPDERALTKAMRASNFVAVIGREDHLLRRLYVRIVLSANPAAAVSGSSAHGITIVFNLAIAPRQPTS